MVWALTRLTGWKGHRIFLSFWNLREQKVSADTSSLPLSYPLLALVKPKMKLDDISG